MKKSLIAVAILLSLPLFLRADPPKKLNVSYSNETKKLKVEAVHPVKNVETHFIDLIAISVNGKEVKVIKPVKQSDPKAETVEVSVPEITSGSKVSVKARCNQFGSKTTEIKVK